MNFDIDGTTTFNPGFGYQAFTNPFNNLVVKQFNDQYQGEDSPPYETHCENKLILTPQEVFYLQKVFAEYLGAVNSKKLPQVVDTTSGYSASDDEEG